MSTEQSNPASAQAAGYKKEMHTRHIVMLALGGVIGLAVVYANWVDQMWARWPLLIIGVWVMGHRRWRTR